MRKPLYYAIVTLIVFPLIYSPVQLRGASLDSTGSRHSRRSVAPISIHARRSSLKTFFGHYPIAIAQSSPWAWRYDLGISVLCMHPTCLNILDTYPIVGVTTSYIRHMRQDPTKVCEQTGRDMIDAHGVGGMVSVELPHFLHNGKEKFVLQAKNKRTLSLGHRITLGYAFIVKEHPLTRTFRLYEPKHYLHYAEEEVLTFRLFKRLEVSPGLGWAIDLFVPNKLLKGEAGYYNLFACRSYLYCSAIARICLNFSDSAKRIYEEEKYKVWKLHKNKRLDLSCLISSKYEPFGGTYSVPIRMCILYSIPMSHYWAFVVESEIGYGSARSLACEPAMKDEPSLMLSARKNVSVSCCMGLEHRYNRLTLQSKVGFNLFNYAYPYLIKAQEKSANRVYKSFTRYTGICYGRATANVRVYKNMFIGIDMRYLELPGLHIGLSL